MILILVCLGVGSSGNLLLFTEAAETVQIVKRAAGLFALVHTRDEIVFEVVDVAGNRGAIKV